MNKSQKLASIAKEIENCKVCKEGKIGKPVVGEGDSDADIVFVGEAPGKKEAETGRPFIGRSGQLLRSLIREVGLREEQVYITSPVKYLPLSGTPSTKDIEHAKVHFLKQLAVIDPKVIVLLGSVAAQAVLGEKLPILKRHGEIVKKDGRRYFLILHPAAALRFQKFKKLLVDDFEKLRSILKRNG